MTRATKPVLIPVLLRVPAEQHAALVGLTKERDVTLSHLLRASIANLTGIPDPIEKKRRYRKPEELSP